MYSQTQRPFKNNNKNNKFNKDNNKDNKFNKDNNKDNKYKKNTKQLIKDFEIEDITYFPELNKKSDKISSIILSDKVDYVSKVKKDEIKPIEESILKEGWMVISREKNGTITYDPPFISQFNDDHYDLNNLNERMDICIQEMIDRWDAYKQDFIEFYGNDTYDTIYSNYYDNMSSVWEESSTDYEDFSDYDESLDE
jgi:hypothetical protein